MHLQLTTTNLTLLIGTNENWISVMPYNELKKKKLCVTILLNVQISLKSNI